MAFSIPSDDYLNTIDLDSKYDITIVTIDEIMEKLLNKTLCILPSQRVYAWTQDMGSEFVDTLIHGNPFPAILLYSNTTNNIKYIEDGQCRLRSVFSFLYGVPVTQWNPDGTAPTPIDEYPAIPNKHVVKWRNMRFVDLPTRIRDKIRMRKVAVMNCPNLSPIAKHTIFTRYNQGKTLKFTDKVWNARDLFPVNKAVAYFFNESGKSHAHLPWTLDKLNLHEKIEKTRPKCGKAVANAAQLYFTAAYGNMLWNGLDTNQNEARVKCLEPNYNTLRMAIDNEYPFDEPNATKTLDEFVRITTFIKDNVHTKKPKYQAQFQKLWKVDEIAGFILLNVLLNHDDPHKLSHRDFAKLVQVCNTDTDPLQRLENIMKCKAPFMYLNPGEYRRRAMDNFRCKHLSNWEDGLKNAKRCTELL